jgi:hypothetical protein
MTEAPGTAPDQTDAEDPRRCSGCHWLREAEEFRRAGTDADGQVKRRARCLPCERAIKHNEPPPTPDPSYVPPPPKPKKPKPKKPGRVPSPPPKKIGWVIAFGCPAERRIVKVGTRTKPEGKVVGVACPACLDPTPHAVVHMARPWMEGESVEAEVTLS